MWTREMGETGEGMIAEQISVAEGLVRDQVRKGCESSPRVQHSLKRPYMQNRKRDRCTEQNFGLYGRRQGWDVSREQHQNMYIIKGETDHQPRLDAWDKCSGLVQWEDPEESGGEGDGRGDRDGEYM